MRRDLDDVPLYFRALDFQFHFGFAVRRRVSIEEFFAWPKKIS